MPMRTLDAVVEEVRSFPVSDRLRLVERIVHEIAETSTSAPTPPQPKVSPVGWLADEPELADQLEKLTGELRARGRVRRGEDEDAG
ncbi:MAG: hypothetical protein U0359_28255 [Byssovorax sp.]